MPQKQRALLIKLNDLIKKLNAPSPTTFSAYTGNTPPPTTYSPYTGTTPPPPKSQT